MKIKGGGARERDGQRRAGQAQAASVAKPYSKRVRPWTRRRKKAPRHERTHAQTRSRTARKTSHRLPLERAEPLLTFQGRRRPTNQSRAVKKKKKEIPRAAAWAFEEGRGTKVYRRRCGAIERRIPPSIRSLLDVPRTPRSSRTEKIDDPSSFAGARGKS